MKHNKIIFLDIDGVVNIPPYQKFTPELVSNIEQLIKMTDAKIVMSSSWRDANTERMKETLIEHGFTEKLFAEIIGITCRGYNHVVKGSKLPIVRGNEIKAWVDTNLVYPWHANPDMKEQYEVKDEKGDFKIMRSNRVGKDFSYVILDDDCDMLLEQEPWFIRCKWDEGFTEERLQVAVNKLNSISIYEPAA